MKLLIPPLILVIVIIIGNSFDVDFLFQNAPDLYRVIFVGIIGYFTILGWIQIFGKRSLAKINAFDFLVTIALGSVLASLLLLKDVSVSEGLTAFLLLLGLQYIIATLHQKVPFVQKFTQAEPCIMFWKGQYQRNEMKRENITEENIRAAVRQEGIGNMSIVDAVVFETTGDMSVIENVETIDGENSSLGSLLDKQNLL
jgi:uncharacterized membrane protein YcaP (DUF421 family)